MTPRIQLKLFTAAAALTLAGFAAGSPAAAQEPLTRAGPVGPYEPILASVGSKRLIAFFVPDNGRCAVNTVVWDSQAAEAPYSSARMRISLNPGQAFQLDGAKLETVSVQCGDNASTLSVGGPALIPTAATSSR
ncbi:hypothetical protein [Methyloceanibacter sp.]|uniref:hypothetical protein n=1 Tax=Methyloceanibacter sp. TaxID=1965321 RepID=UPI003D6CBC08